jgi:hypothetical protein
VAFEVLVKNKTSTKNADGRKRKREDAAKQGRPMVIQKARRKRWRVSWGREGTRE